MKRILVLIVVAMWPASAQVVPDEQLQRVLREWQLRMAMAPAVPQSRERQAADARRREFAAKANKVAAIWKKVMAAYTKDGVFNVKDARALSKAFRELEATGWPQ